MPSSFSPAFMVRAAIRHGNISVNPLIPKSKIWQAVKKAQKLGWLAKTETVCASALKFEATDAGRAEVVRVWGKI
jgi:hypothetical protein